MLISMIVAASERGVIGRSDGINGGLPWRLPADLRRFKSLTMGHTLIMGRRTYDTVGKPLPGRRTIVITRSQAMIPGVITASSVEAAIKEARRVERGELFIAGGAEIYALAMPFVQRIYLTRVGGEVKGDVAVALLDGGVPEGYAEIAPPESLDEPPGSHTATLHIYERPLLDDAHA